MKKGFNAGVIVDGKMPIFVAYHYTHHTFDNILSSFRITLQLTVVKHCLKRGLVLYGAKFSQITVQIIHTVVEVKNL